MKKILFLLTMSANFQYASAYRFEYGNNVTISKPVYEDLYIAGGNVTINAPVYGDLIVAGGTVIINDTVTNDVMVAGGTVTFNGFVGDDIRCAGGNIRVGKNVTGDVVLTCGSILIDKDVMIGGLISSGGNVKVDGTITGNVKGYFGEFFLNGATAKDLDCRAGKIHINGTVGGNAIMSGTTIVIGRDAAFNGNIHYWNKKGMVDFKQSLKSTKATYDPSLKIKTNQWYYLGSDTLPALLFYLGMALVMILLLQYLFSVTLKRAADTVYNYSLKSLGYGFLFFIAIPVATLLAFVTIIGVPVGILMLISYVTLILLATVITSVVWANWVVNRNNKSWNNWHISFAAFGIFIALKLVSLMPFAGWLILLFLICMSFGSIVLSINWRKRQREMLVAPAV